MKEIVITANESGQRLDKFLRKYLPEVSLGAIYKAIRLKEVTVNGKKSDQKYILNTGDTLNFYLNTDKKEKAKDYKFLETEYDFKVAYEDENILVAEKKQGVLIHPDEGGDYTLTDQVKAYLYEKKEYNPEDERIFSPSPCNRLDRNTEGLVIFAKNYDALKDMNEMIRDNGIEKYYSTIVKGRIGDGEYRAYITKDNTRNHVSVHPNYKEGSKEIITRVINVESIGQFSHIDIELITGRSHQIRAHLSSLGSPIIGDPKYGDKKVNSYFKDKYSLENQLLTAYKLYFNRTSGSLGYLEGKTVTMPVPSVFKKIKNDIFKF